MNNNENSKNIQACRTLLHYIVLLYLLHYIMYTIIIMTLHLQGDYDLVITDYTRARSLFGDTEVLVFKKGKDMARGLNVFECCFPP